jgi:hypothetical protein
VRLRLKTGLRQSREEAMRLRAFAGMKFVVLNGFCFEELRFAYI